eukprot:7380814-Prymnesium_polylepis.2
MADANVRRGNVQPVGSSRHERLHIDRAVAASKKAERQLEDCVAREIIGRAVQASRCGCAGTAGRHAVGAVWW